MGSHDPQTPATEAGRRLRIAYADPPYLGMCNLYGHEHMGGGCWNDIGTHRQLIERLQGYDGWALSLHVPSLRDILPLVPTDARVLAYCKTMGAVIKGVSPQWMWEPVLMVPARKQRPNGRLTPRDWLATFPGIGFKGAKPEGFTTWLLDCLGAEPGDEIDDLFYGSGAVTNAIDAWRRQQRLFA